ncbi:MAG TPA: hypothetical protein VF765_03455 [Polyangiaceae bacterium]
MDSYDICSACSCFIKTAETACPFCGAEHHARSRPVARARRMSRAQWLALGSALVLTSCGGSVKPGPTGTQGSGQQGGDDNDAQAGTDSGQTTGDDTDAAETVDAVATGGDASTIGHVEAGAEPDASEVADAPASCTVPRTTFQCAGSSCNSASQYCYISYGGTEVACEDDNAGGYFPQQCLTCPTCDCVSQYIGGPGCKCVDLGGGAIGVQCAGCYGAPPTRLELLAA